MASIPRRNARTAPQRGGSSEIPGIVPSLREPIAGCAFAPRCAFARERCRAEAPPLRTSRHRRIAVACWEAERVMAA